MVSKNSSYLELYACQHTPDAGLGFALLPHGLNVVAQLVVKTQQVGTGEARLRWERPKVQRTVSGERVGRRRMMIKEGRRIREEVSMVALGSGLGNP